MNGPGIYDDLCTQAREQAQAAGVALIVIDGKLGGGFSVQGTAEVLAVLPNMLESMARQIRADLGLVSHDPKSFN